MNRMASSVFAAAAGAAASYWFDPEAGRRRRALAADRLASRALAGRRFAELAARDARNRGSGLAAEARSLLRSRPPADDAILVERVRSQLGRVASHPHALEVAGRDACITLSGPVLAREADALLDCAKHVRGVATVEDRLTRHEHAGRIPALQGGRPHPGPSAWEFAQQSWSPSARAGALALGLALLADALARRRALARLLGLAGAALVARSLTNVELAHLLAAGGRGEKVEKSIRIEAPLERVFAFWRDAQNFPRFMSHVHEVSGDVGGTTHWRVDGWSGPTLQWSARCTALEDNRLIAWETLDGSAVRHAGRVRFEPCADGATRVHVQLTYQPPAGALGHGVARLAGFDPKRQFDDDLMRAKMFLETGRAAHDAAASAASRARPSPVHSPA